MRKILVIWLLGWALFGLPWSSFSSRPRFYRISLVPFQRTRRRDQLLNFVYYVPFGVVGTLLGWSPLFVSAAAAVLSGVTEVLQVFSPSRFPSTTDFVLNVAGALVGIALAIHLRVRNRSTA